jgi:hypothetical protein
VTGDQIYSEKVTSNWTEALFVVLAILFFVPFAWQVRVGEISPLSILFFCLSAVFLFYALNYRTLIIQLNKHALKLTFGVFTWRVPLDNIEDCRLDEIPVLLRYGGAGIHFMFVRQRYRASFNFLEHPRVVIAFKRQVGPVRDISFTTRRPDEVLRLIREAVATHRAV